MGFLEDIEWIIDKLPEEKQMVLFSATMPREIKNIAKKYLNNPAEIKIKSIKKEAQLISQKFISIQRHYKLEALKRILEIKNEGVIIFVRTKSLTVYNLILSILLTFIISNKIKIEEEYLTKKFHNYISYKNEVKI